MKEFIKKALWVIFGLVYLPVVFILYFVLFSSFGKLGQVPAMYFGCSGLIALMLCRKKKFFLVGLLLGILLIITVYSLGKNSKTQIPADQQVNMVR